MSELQDRLLADAAINPHPSSVRNASDSSPGKGDVSFQTSGITSRNIHDFAVFRGEIEWAMKPHIEAVNLIDERMFGEDAATATRETVRKSARKFRAGHIELQKAYRTYIETATDSTLIREAQRLKRRYFPETPTDEQINFIKLKRYYEKIRSFNGLAERIWREIMKVIDAYGILSETKLVVRELKVGHLNNINLLILQTNSFLEALKTHMGAEEEVIDQVTGSCRIVVAFSPDIRYTIGGFFGDEKVASDAENGFGGDGKASQAVGPDPYDEVSIARSIILETRERKMNRAGVFRAEIPGSRDWNRTPEYGLEVSVSHYEECIRRFKSAHEVRISRESVAEDLNAATLDENLDEETSSGADEKGDEKKKDDLETYSVFIHNLLERIAEMILNKDFPGMDKPLIFLYHIGPVLMHKLLMMHLEREKIGDIVRHGDDGIIVHELPEEMIKKILIDWWNIFVAGLDAEDLDSYISYSRCLDMVKMEYRILYEAGVSMKRAEQPGIRYYDVDRWLSTNRTRVFGFRKYEIIKRFLDSALIV